MDGGTITAIEPQLRNKDRANVFLDGRYAFSLTLAVAVELKVGTALTTEAITQLKMRDGFEKAKQGALQLIARRPRSAAEIRKYLFGKGYDAEVIDQVLSRLGELELLDDAAFADYWVEQRDNFRPRSPRALRHELQQKGIDRDVINNAVGEVDELSAARRSAVPQANRLAVLPREAFYQKLTGFLQRRGFGFAVVREVVDELWRKLGSGETDNED
jgi:regulatory protein